MFQDKPQKILRRIQTFYDTYPIGCQISVLLFVFCTGFLLHDPIYSLWQTAQTEDIIYEPTEEVENQPMEDNTIYTGGISNGKRQGWGQLVTKKRNVYEGEWNQNKLKRGTLKYWDAKTQQYTQAWEGPFDSDLSPDGFGRMTYNNDSVYIGCYENSYRSGFGRMFYKDGKQLFGEWKKGRLQNASSLYHPEDSVYGIDISRWKSRASLTPEGKATMTP